MASPQIENGYTKIANELLEAFAKKQMSGRAFRCVLAIIRETYGWKKKEAVLSNYKLSGLTGIAPQHIFSVIKELESVGIITKVPNPRGTVIAINKNYEKWLQFGITETGITKNGITKNGITETGITGITENGNTGITENGNTGITENGNTDYLTGPLAERIPDTPKERLKKDKERLKKDGEYSEVFPPGLDTEDFRSAWDLFKQHRKEIKKPMKPTQEQALLKKLATVGIVEAIERIDKSISNGWQGLFFANETESGGKKQEEVQSQADIMHKTAFNNNFEFIVAMEDKIAKEEAK